MEREMVELHLALNARCAISAGGRGPEQHSIVVAECPMLSTLNPSSLLAVLYPLDTDNECLEYHL